MPSNKNEWSANTRPGSGTSLGRTTTVTFTFTKPSPFTPPQVEGFEGKGLFFDPYLRVQNTGETIHIKDKYHRFLYVPSDYQWPQENVPIWYAYWEVIEEIDENGFSYPEFNSPTWYQNPDTSLLWKS